MKEKKGSRGIAALILKLGSRRGEWSTPHSGHSNSGKKTRYALYRTFCCLQERSGRLQKILPLSGFDPLNLQAIKSLYTD
jgi:hypothetical protein